MSGFVSPFDESTKRQAMAEFEETWKEYSSASAAAKAIAKDWGMGRTTLTEWLQEENLWPSPTVKQIQHLQREINRLKRRNEHLQEENERLRRLRSQDG